MHPKPRYNDVMFHGRAAIARSAPCRLAAAVALAFVLAALVSAPGARGDDTPRLPHGLIADAPGTVATVIDGDTLTFTDGREVRLVGIQAPKLPLGRPDFEAWPLAPQAKQALTQLVEDRALTPHFGGRRADRHGRVLAHLTRSDGLWVQGALLARGMARVYSFADNRRAVRDMYAIEAASRAAERGIWSHPYYRVLDHGETNRHVGTFQLVEGRVRESAVVRGRAYLNYGTDWRTDFTVLVPRPALALFRAQFGRRLERLEGERIRVRGWLKRYNGPMIEATHPEQIEVLTQ